MPPGPLPILFRRTPYGVPADASGIADGSLKELARDGYIFVVQNLRGTIRIGRHLRAVVEGRSRESEGDQRDHRRLRLDRLAGARTCRTTTARSACSACSYDGLTVRDDAAASASGAESDLGAGVARGSMDERRRPSLWRAARKLRLRICRVRAGGQERQHALRFRDLRYLFLVPRRSARCRTSTPGICTDRFRTGTRSSSIPTTTSSGRRKPG